MVWNSNSSTLYKAVERHNNAERIVPEKTTPAQEMEHFSPPPVETAHKKPVHNKQQNSPISGLLQDRDALLITALILILMHEKADTKLILALVFVLLG